ncbi:MAG: hypothetical protein H0V73_10140 [Chloroflexi bacterium]|nr:hypothetical protein [Chloroflexota bacterium]
MLVVLADPRQLITANHPKPILERSAGATGVGSWAVIGLDQLRARVEYVSFDRERVTATIVMSGSGAAAARQSVTDELADGAAGGTAIHLSMSGSGGFLPFTRLLWPLAWRRIRTRLRSELPGTGDTIGFL